MDEVIDRCRQPDGYGAVCGEARAEAEAAGLTLPAHTPPTQEELDAAAANHEADEERARAMARITMAEAEGLGREGIRQKYGQMAALLFMEEASLYRMSGDTPVIAPCFRLAQQEESHTDGDGSYIVDVNALDGTIEDILYGNGLRAWVEPH